MWRLFNLKKQETKIETDLPQAIVKNKEAISTLEKRQAHLECRIAFQETDAKRRAMAGDKRGALFALKRKKMFEKELEQLGNAHLTLEQQIITLESAQAQQVAVGALAAGVTAQKVLNQKLNLSKIDDLIEDMQEQSNLQNELAQVLSQGNPLCDDAELLNELQELEARQLEETLADVGPVPSSKWMLEGAFVQFLVGIASPGKIVVSQKANTLNTLKSNNVISGDTSYANVAHPLASNMEDKRSMASDEEQLEKLLQDLS